MRRLIAIICLMLLPGLAVAQGLPPVDPAVYVGDILISGSETLHPLTQRMISGFQTAGAQGQIIVNTSSTNDAMIRFCNGELDIVQADREPTADEMNACSAANRNPVVMPIAADAVVVAVSQDNPVLNNATLEEIQQLFGGAVSWSQVQPSWPEQPINRLLPGMESDTFATFVDVVFSGDQRTPVTSVGARFHDDLNALFTALQNDPYAVGILPASFANRNIGALRIVGINGVSPTSDNVSSGVYPMSRQLYLISHAAQMQQQQHVAAFLNYYISSAPEQIAALGYYPVDLSVARERWLQAAQDLPTTLPQPEVVTEPTEEPLPDAQVAEEPTLEPTEEVLDPEEEAALDALQILADARADMELFAVNLFGVERPEGWNGGLNTEDAQLSLLIRLDLELLAANAIGTDTRPDGWFGAVASTPYAIARDIRHDLELLADDIYAPGERPTGWVGPSDALMRCNRDTQALVGLLTNGGFFTPTANPATLTYCDDVAREASVFSETMLLNKVDTALFTQQAILAGGGSFAGSTTITSDFAVGFYDRNANYRGGVIPNGTPVTPRARSYADFSNMMLVEGEGFMLYIEYINTPLTSDEFYSLGDASLTGFETYCDTRWCR